jgi:ssDNA-binding replication factor A large subunit
MTSTDLTLKDLYIGANDITIVARVLAVYPISEFNKKDGGTGRYRKVTLFDRDNQSKLTIWDDNPDAMKLYGISADTPVRVLNGYVRQGLDGKPNLNIGKKGKVELLEDEKLVSRLEPLTKLSKKVGEIGDSQTLAAVEGRCGTDSRTSTFSRKDGSSGSLTQFELRGDSEKDRIRVVVWDAIGLEVKAGQAVLVTNLRVKKNLNGEDELHGDKGTLVRVTGAEMGGVPSKPAKVSQVKEARHRYDLEVMALSQLQVSDVQLKEGGSVRKGELVVGDDTGEISLTAWRDMVKMLEGVDVGDKVKVLGVMAQQSRMGGILLELDESSRIEKVPA